ncbi:LicD family protein [Parabacteroides distasonis]|uniref:LicD family protein n=1 Tax=Parabacteroides distasonis TaxID=823 RepID=A0AAX3QSU2_PARDI|nr:LicD family protein [Parabacteroides distasonis]MCS2556341.1 LicD family protein [Parabacteroides distasonis]WET65756.1 LicD family protein [Parabacteroides distasonis]
MKRTTDCLNDDVKRSDGFYELSDDERYKLKQCLMEIYQDITFICKKYNLTFMLGGGSALGAVRHKGFIPWDDDLDLMMSREDYNKLIKVFPKEVGDKYIISYPNRNCNSMTLFLKIIKRNTLMKYWDDTDDYISGIYIDVFPMEGVPNDPILRCLKGIFVFVMRKISTSVKIYRRKNDSLKRKMNLNSISCLYYKLSITIGAIFSFVGEKRLDYFFDRFVSSDKNTKYMTIPTGRKSYFGELLPYSVFFPVSKGIFEGVEVNLPNQVDIYLTNLYGDYMKIPPAEKRERHYFTDFSLDVTK